jgi:hypothetical protein
MRLFLVHKPWEEVLAADSAADRGKSVFAEVMPSLAPKLVTELDLALKK